MPPSDATVLPGISYSYNLRPNDYHGNYSRTTSSVTTPAIRTGSGPYPSVTPEGSRVGVPSNGAYWGAGGENIDVMYGNLDFSLPLLSATARGGMSAAVSFNYKQPKVTVTLNRYNDDDPNSAYLNDGYASVNAEYLIYELGHAFNDLFGRGSSTIEHDVTLFGKMKMDAEDRNKEGTAPCLK